MYIYNTYMIYMSIYTDMSSGIKNIEIHVLLVILSMIFLSVTKPTYTHIDTLTTLVGSDFLLKVCSVNPDFI